MPYDSMLSTHGDPEDTYRITCADVPKSLSDYGIPLVREDGVPAIAVLISVETNAARIKWGAKNGQGHPIAANGNYMGYGQSNVKKLKLGNSTVSSNAVAEVTVYF